MTTLTGSEKQIAWATEIRAQIVAQVNRVVDATTPDGAATHAWLEANAYSKTEVKWWIDNRSEILQQANCAGAAVRAAARAARRAEK